MPNNDNDRILRLRNETSLCLDDLVALVVNRSLSFDLRLFSAEIMELQPGFAFSLKQAQTLRNLTLKSLKQYQVHAISDGELMNYLANARIILKGEEQMIGGKQMNVFKRILHGKEIKKQESLNKMEQDYKDVWEQILSCEDDMVRCIEASRGCSPASMIYRNNERVYNNAKNRLTLLHKQEKILSSALDQTTRIQLMKKFNERQKAIERITGVVLGDEKTIYRTLIEAEINTEKIEHTLDKVRDYGASFFDAPEEELRTDSEFAAKVAADERRQAIMNTDNMGVSEFQAAINNPNTEFSKLTNARETEK